MTFTEILTNPFLNIPRNWRNLGYNSYFECIESEGRKYIKLIDDLEDFNFGEIEILGDLSKQHLHDAVRRFYDVLLKTLETYLNEGSPHKAYTIFDESFGIKEGKIANPRQLVFFLEFRGLFPHAYRLRYKNNPKLHEMFHVPFEMRQKVHSYRYSIPGFPTLYLSNSVYLAFQELNCSDYDDLFAVKLRLRHTQDYESLLDMTNRPLIGEKLYQFKYLARWLLIMACSIKVGYPTEPFRPEYIIPQITLQWVKNNMHSGSKKIFGVCYPSSKIDQNIEGFRGEFYNIALPIQIPNKTGYCEILKAKFCLTQPLSFRNGLSQNFTAGRQSETTAINLNGAQVDYINTDFGKIEEVFDQKPFNEWFLVDGTKLS